MFDEFFDGNLDLSRLNYGIVTLIPKGQGADKIKMYRLICLLSVSFKIFTKIMADRLAQVISKYIEASQTAFIKHRYYGRGFDAS